MASPGASPCLLTLTLPWQPLFDKRFSEFRISLFLIKIITFFQVNFTFLNHYLVRLLILVIFFIKLGDFEGSGKIKKSKMAESSWPLFENRTLL